MFLLSFFVVPWNVRNQKYFFHRGSKFEFCLFVFLVDEVIQIPIKVGHHWPAIEMAFRWRANDGPTLNAGLVGGSRPVLLGNSVFW